MRYRYASPRDPPKVRRARVAFSFVVIACIFFLLFFIYFDVAVPTVEICSIRSIVTHANTTFTLCVGTQYTECGTTFSSWP